MNYNKPRDEMNDHTYIYICVCRSLNFLHRSITKMVRECCALDFSKRVLSLSLFTLLIGCSNIPNREYVLELTGTPSTQCEITNDEKVVGTFTVPSTVNLGSEVGKIEANCIMNNKTVVAKVKAADAHCQDQLVVKGTCPKQTSAVDSVEIIVRQSK